MGDDRGSSPGETGKYCLGSGLRAGSTGEAFGIDLTPGMVEASRCKAEQANEKITFQLGRIDNIPFPDNRFDVVVCSFMIFHMSEETKRRGIAEIYRVLKPGGSWLVLDMASPINPVQRAIARLFFGGMLQHELSKLLPVMKASGFSNIDSGPAKFTILGLPILGFVRGCAQK